MAFLRKTWHKTTSRVPRTKPGDDSQETSGRSGLLLPATHSEPALPIQQYQNLSVASQGGKFFEGSHDFVINNLNVVNQEIQGKTHVLKELKECTIPGAEFNSAERDPPPRCHPGTRTSIRADIRSRIEDINLGTRVIWIHGPAGVGKSAIMQTLAEEVSPHAICTTAFLSRANQRDESKKVFPTLAYSLAVVNPQYRQYIGTKMEDDPTFLKKSLDDQFNTLFVTPFVNGRIKADPRPWIVLLDGLDECQNTKNADNQCRILNLICDSIFHHAKPTPFIWVIASRPEGNLKKAWQQTQRRFQGRVPELWELVIPVNSDQATQDVELYLHKQFEIIRINYSELIPGPRWPSESDFLRIARKSSGLFVFAATVTRYISDEDPVSRLRYIISLINRIEKLPPAPDDNPLHTMDLLYSSIMSDIPKRQLPVINSLIGYYRLLDVAVARHSTWEERRKMRLVETCNILGLQQNEAYAALRQLQSVLSYPSPENAHENGIEFFHTSFLDFLLDKSRSQEYHIDLDLVLTEIWRSYARIIKESKPQGATGIQVFWLPNNQTSLLAGIRRDLLKRARSGWIYILINNLYTKSAKRQLLVDVPELLDAFQNLGVAFLGGDRLPVQRFLDWLDECAPEAIREKIVSQRFPLRQLDIERLFRSLCATPRYQYGMNTDVWEFNLGKTIGGLDPSQWEQAKEILWTPSSDFKELVKVFDEDVSVVVIGMESSDSCAIVGPCTKNAFGRNFYVLPYFII